MDYTVCCVKAEMKEEQMCFLKATTEIILDFYVDETFNALMVCFNLLRYLHSPVHLPSPGLDSLLPSAASIQQGIGNSPQKIESKLT